MPPRGHCEKGETYEVSFATRVRILLRTEDEDARECDAKAYTHDVLARYGASRESKGILQELVRSFQGVLFQCCCRPSYAWCYRAHESARLRRSSRFR